MFKKIRLISCVKYFILKKHKLFILDFKKNIFEEERLISTSGYDDIHIKNDKIFFNDQNNNVITINNNDEKILFESKTIINSNSDFNDYQLIIVDSNEKLSLINLIDYQKIDLKSIDYDWENIVINNRTKLFFLIGQSYIHAYSLPDATPLWQYEVSELGTYDVLFSTEKRNYEVVKFLGVWQEELLVAFQGSLLMAFDVQTGKVTRQWQELPAHADEELRNIFRGKIHEKGTVFQLNLAGDKIVAIYLRHYLEIDLATSEIHVKNLSQTLHQHQMVDFNHKSGYAEDETHFYTTVHLDQEKLGLKYIPTVLCALNKSTLEIDWFYRFDQDGTGDYVSVQIPQVSHNKLYQLTQNNVLYVFEKE